MCEQQELGTVKTIKKGLLAAVMVMLLAVPGLAVAMPGMGAEAAPQEFDQSTLQSFAVASVELQEIQQEYAQRLEGVQDQEQAIELQRQANEEMVATVEEEGIDVQTYNAIANEMNTSPELHARVMELIEQEQNR